MPMAEFKSPWMTWVPRDPRVEENMREGGTDKTDRSASGQAFVSFVSAYGRRNNPDDSSGALADSCVGCGARAVAWGSEGGGTWCVACWKERVGEIADGALPALPILAETHAGLTEADRARLAAEAAAGDELAQLVLQSPAPRTRRLAALLTPARPGPVGRARCRGCHGPRRRRRPGGTAPRAGG